MAEQMRRHSPYNYAFNNPIMFIDPDGMGPQGCCTLPSWRAIKNAFNDFRNKLPKIDFNAKITFGAQAGINIGKVAKADLTVFNFNIAETKISTNKGRVTSRETEVVGTNVRTGKSDGVQVENKVGITVAGTTVEAGFDHQMHAGSNGPYTTGTKSVVKYGGLLSDSNFKPNSANGMPEKPAAGASLSSLDVTETRFGTETKYKENSFELGWKALLGVEIKFKW